MPRAFCPECGSEVPVDPDGICHVGHVVGLSAASVGPSDELEVEFADASRNDSDEPEPWVASVDHTQLGGYTPPPDATAAAPEPEPPMPEPAWTGSREVPPPPPSAPASPPPAASVPPDAPAWTPSDGLDDEDDEPEPGIFDLGISSPDDLASAAAAAAAEAGLEDDADEVEPTTRETLWGSDDRAPGWTPPSEAIAPPPEPPPAPVEPPAPAHDADDLGDFDLADLEAAVVEMETGPASAPEPEPVSPASALQELDAIMRDEDHGDEAAGDEAETVTTEIDLPPPSAPAEPAPAPKAEDEPTKPALEPGLVGSFPRPSDAAGPAEPVDLSNFTAKGDKVRDTDAESSGRKGFFRLRR